MITSKRIYIIVALLLSTFSLLSPEFIKAQNSPKRKRALVIGLDGTTGFNLHQRVWSQKKAPAFQELMSLGKYTACPYDQHDSCARAHSGPIHDVYFYWKSAPGWASIITGVDSLRHGVKKNGHEDMRVFTDTSKSFPSFFKRAKDAGLKTAAGGSATFLHSRNNEDGIAHGISDYECGTREDGPDVDPDATSNCVLDIRHTWPSDDSTRDGSLAVWLVNQINDPTIDITMGVFDTIDSAGHARGYDGNKTYLTAISNVDALLDRVLKTLKDRAENHNEEWLVVMTADHGGHRAVIRGDHSRFRWKDNAIPFAVTLFGSDLQLKDLTYPVTHMDVHPTIMRWFGLDSPLTDGHVQGIN